MATWVCRATLTGGGGVLDHAPGQAWAGAGDAGRLQRCVAGGTWGCGQGPGLRGSCPRWAGTGRPPGGAAVSRSSSTKHKGSAAARSADVDDRYCPAVTVASAAPPVRARTRLCSDPTFQHAPGCPRLKTALRDGCVPVSGTSPVSCGRGRAEKGQCPWQAQVTAILLQAVAWGLCPYALAGVHA